MTWSHTYLFVGVNTLSGQLASEEIMINPPSSSDMSDLTERKCLNWKHKPRGYCMYVRMSSLRMRIFCPDSSLESSPQSNPQSIPESRVQLLHIPLQLLPNVSRYCSQLLRVSCSCWWFSAVVNCCPVSPAVLTVAQSLLQLLVVVCCRSLLLNVSRMLLLSTCRLPVL